MELILQQPEFVTATFYVCDASGNVMAVYKTSGTTNLTLEEQHIYGSSRLGIFKKDKTIKNKARALGERRYELTDHLGNVRVVMSDYKRTAVIVLSATDYYPFGMVARTYTSPEEYRYGFNGKELDRDEEGLGGGGSTYDYGFRIYNPALARFLSVDPLTRKYPYLTPYQFASNTPIFSLDIDGLEGNKQPNQNENPVTPNGGDPIIDDSNNPNTPTTPSTPNNKDNPVSPNTNQNPANGVQPNPADKSTWDIQIKPTYLMENYQYLESTGSALIPDFDRYLREKLDVDPCGDPSLYNPEQWIEGIYYSFWGNIKLQMPASFDGNGDKVINPISPRNDGSPTQFNTTLTKPIVVNKQQVEQKVIDNSQPTPIENSIPVDSDPSRNIDMEFIINVPGPNNYQIKGTVRLQLPLVM
jgi:RHS repeat-associated protein